MYANSNPTDLANAAWKQVFEERPYTGFIMLDYLRVHANLEWSDILGSNFTKKGFAALRQVKTKKEAVKKDPGLSEVWDNQPGRCTSFAVKVISLLEKQAPDTFKFNIYDIGRHRVARCEKTAILIDSSALHGAFPLSEGQWVRMEGSEASWKWVKGKSKFERIVGVTGIKESKTIVSKEEALSTCLFELHEANSIPTLFRSFDPQTRTAEYHAIVKWQWNTKTLEIIPFVQSKDKFIIKFGGGTDATNLECVDNLAKAIEHYGGPHYRTQWTSVEAINKRIWEAAIEVWGNPQWIFAPS